MARYEHLLEPISIGGVKIRNRVAICPMCLGYAEKDGSVNDLIVSYFAARARGGTGLIFTGFTFIDDKVSRSGPNQMGAYDDRLIPGLRKLAQTVQKEGAKIFLQIVHGGRQANSALFGEKRLAPSAVATEGIPAATEMSEEQIEEVIEAFGQAARRGKEAGFDGVEMHGAHGYLMASFMSDFTNRRNDRWGGDFERRMRFPLAVLARIKEVCGEEYPVGFRFSGDEYLRFMDENLSDVGITVPVGQNIAEAMQEAGVAHLSVSSCVAETAYTAIQPLYWPRGFNLHLARAVREVATVPVIAAGSITDPEMAEEAIANGTTDMVALGRALIADPEWANKMGEGRPEDIRPCIRCCECTANREEQPTTQCAVNFEMGREREPAPRAEKPRRVLVAGGGPAGMEAALRAAIAGHKVTLCEKGKALGGYLLPGSAPDFKDDIRRLVTYYPAQLTKAGVEVRLECPLAEGLVKEVRPDDIILALGSVPIVPQIPGVQGSNVHQAVDVLNDSELVEGKKVVVIGGGHVGCEVGLFLAQKGKRVTVLEMLPEILADEEIGVNKTVLLRLLSENEVKTVVNARATEIRDEAVVTIVDGEERTFSADVVVLSVGLRPTEEPPLPEVKAKVHRIGDPSTWLGVVSLSNHGKPPASIFEAVQAGARMARSLSVEEAVRL